MTTPSDPAPDPWNACALAPSAVTQRYRMERRHNGNGTVEVLASHVGALPALTAAFDAFIHLDTRDGAGVYRSTDPAWQLVVSLGITSV